MAEQASAARTEDDIPANERLMRPGVELNLFVWLFVVGAPLLLLFLLFSKHAG